MEKIRSYLFAFFFLVIFSAASASQHIGETNTAWKAGVASVNITPKEPVWMGGYAFRDRPAEGKITDLWAKALALEDANGHKAVIVTMDLHRIPKEVSDNIRHKLSEKLHLSRSQIILNASHTHTGPVFGNHNLFMYNLFADSAEIKKVSDYAKFVETKIVNLVVEAFSRMKEVQLYSGNGIARFQVNRHTNAESALKRTTHLNGPNDYAVPVIKVVDGNNKMIAILFGYACHNTTLSVYKWSGDYAGFAQIELEKDFPGAIALFFQGAGGDQNPLPRGTIAKAEQYGKELAAAVSATISEEMKPLESRLSVTYSEINLPFAKQPPTKEELIQIINDSSVRAYPAYLKRGAKYFLQILEKGGAIMSSYPWYPVQVWNVGGQTIFAFGGELTIGYAVELKRIFGQDIFVLGYSNDQMSYIPTAKMLDEGGYETIMSPVFTTPYAPTIENIIISQAIKEAEKTGRYANDSGKRQDSVKARHSTNTVPVQNSSKRAGYSYLDNPQYFYRMEVFAGEKAQKNVVMLGNSLTEGGKWNEILERTDVANRGIGSDITEGYISRMNYVFNLDPKICFIEGGVNDLGRKVPQDTTIRNLAILIDTLRGKGIVPVLTAVTYLADNYTAHEPKAFNSRVKSLNRAIKVLAKQKKVKLIDLNPKISDGSFLIKKYAIADGIHYTEETYSLWGKEIIKALDRLLTLK